MKMNRILALLAGIALFGACKKDDDKPADVAITGKWTMISQYRTYTQADVATKDTINYAAASNHWTFGPTAGKIYQVKDAQPDTVYYKLVDSNKKVVTAVDDEFIFQVDTLSILNLAGNQLKL